MLMGYLAGHEELGVERGNWLNCLAARGGNCIAVLEGSSL